MEYTGAGLLRMFETAFEFIKGLKEFTIANATRYKLKYIVHPLNAQIDVQPIPLWYYQSPPWSIPGGTRKLYLLIALDSLAGGAAGYQVIINFALDMMSNRLGVYAYKIQNGKRTDILADTTTVSPGQDRQVAMQILDKLQKALEIK